MALSVFYHGHSNVEIQAGAYRIQLDPFYTSNPLAGMKADKANPNFILISHAHFDHTEDALAIAKRTAAVIASNYEITSYFEKHGAPKTQGMNHGGSVQFPFGRATYTVAFHTSSFPDGTYGGQPGGWILEFPAAVTGTPKTIYFAGDTALFGDMKLLGELYNIDLAFLPIGDQFTMGPAHAVKAAQFLKAKKVVPIHYNTWPPIAQDAAKFVADLKAVGIEGVAMKSGETLAL
jgi:L-ascorbate metabolism protein UlaG (beta-lactamase superfamily)